ncbi:MAG: DUF1080 domain-containing protein [Planctomycetota bacterium]
MMLVSMLALVALSSTAAAQEGTAGGVGQQVKPSGSSQTSGAGGASATWQTLFDGKTLKGWNGDAKYFRVENQTIIAGRFDQRIPHNYFLCTDQTFGDFELMLQCKLVANPKGPSGNNAGIQFRTQRVAGSTEVSGYQADMGSVSSGPVWGSLYDESRRRKFLASADAAVVASALRPGQWNDYRIVCRGDTIQLYLNGVKTVDYQELLPPEKVAREGVVALQIHSGPPLEAHYRAIRLRQLP